MKLSERTISILKNFATINDSLLFVKGRVQQTVDEADAIQCVATLDEEFPIDFGIYDLRTLLANIAALKEPDIKFDKTSLTITDGTIRITYNYTNPRNIKSPSGSVDIENPDVVFILTNQTFQKLVKIADLNGLEYLSVRGRNGIINVQGGDGTDTSNKVDMDVDTYEGDDFNVVFTLENMKILPDDYEVGIYTSGLGVFENTSKTIKYYITLNQDN